MAVIGFNIGSTISLGDMELAVDYLADKDSFEPDLQNIKNSVTNNTKTAKNYTNNIKEENYDNSEESYFNEEESNTLEEENKNIEIKNCYNIKEENDALLEEKCNTEEETYNQYNENNDEEEEIDDYEELGDDYDIFDIGVSEDSDNDADIIDTVEEYNEPYITHTEEKTCSNKEKEIRLSINNIKTVQEDRNTPKINIEEIKKIPINAVNTPKKVGKQIVNNKKQVNNIDYSIMETEALYSEVRLFMQQQGVSKGVINKTMLDERFGQANIRKLILKSYLIIIGKGVTIGK